MAEFFRLHAMRWAADGGSQGIRGSAVEAFHRDATHYLAEAGKLRLYTMWLEGRAVASVYGLLDRGKFLYFQSGYDPQLRARSVGLVLVGETFRDALEAGCAEYDFLRGTESYKADWTTLRRQTVALTACATNLGRAWDLRRAGARGVRHLAKGLLPDRLVEQVRRLRRRRSQVVL
jgi:CelD/BcsL family acetyltransferase involved in cellulose biosynthesis